MKELFIGHKVGRYTVIGDKFRDGNRTKVRCRCECGEEKNVRVDALGKTTFSCGCLNRFLSSERNKANKTIHGKRKDKIYKIYYHMLERCYSEKTQRYKNYGGRGIVVCDDWLLGFVEFLKWAESNGYKEGLSLERIDVNGNYEPINCKWIDKKYQARNKVNTIRTHYKDELLPLIEISEITGIKYACLLSRYRRGDRGERLVR